MNKKLYISHFCRIRNNKLEQDGKILFESDPDEPLGAFLKKCYRHLGIKYPKFFKMDHLSKISFLGAELVLSSVNLEDYNNDVALCFSNRASSLDTDRKHYETIADPENFFPSPAVFVYTLPNIGMGEISIRHGLKSENSFFIFEAFKADFHVKYTGQLIREAKAHAVLNAWVEVDAGKYDVFMYLVSEQESTAHTVEQIKELYHKII